LQLHHKTNGIQQQHIPPLLNASVFFGVFNHAKKTPELCVVARLVAVLCLGCAKVHHPTCGIGCRQLLFGEMDVPY
jgi:hypothetical protein